MGQLLRFPENSSNKIRLLQKREAKRLALTLSVLSVAVMAITLNERIHNEQRPQYVWAGSVKMDQLNRAIASAQPLNLIEDLQAENEWAKRLNEIERRPSSIGQRPSKADQFRYGQLAGKYRIAENNNQVSELEYVDSTDVSDRPIMLRNSKDFLVENKEVFSVSFEHVEPDTKSAKSEVFRLLSGSGQFVGRAAFEYDDAGHLLSLKVQDQK